MHALVLAPIPVSDRLYAIREEAKALAEKLAPLLRSEERLEKVRGGETLELDDDDVLIFVEDAFLTLTVDGQRVRFYEEGEIVVGRRGTLSTDFAATLYRWRGRDLPPWDAELAAAWQRYQSIHMDIVNGLCACYGTKAVQPRFALRNVAPGDLIVREGSTANAVFLMVTGSATVLANGREVGAIAAGEIFGEVAFLCRAERSASVVAAEPCTVQEIDADHFDELIAARPDLVLTLTRTLAERLRDATARLRAA